MDASPVVGSVLVIDIGRIRQSGAFTSHIGERAHEALRQCLLYRQSPLRHLQILAIAISFTRRDDAVRVAEKRRDGIREVRNGVQRVLRNLVVDRKVLVVELSIAMIDAEAAANDGVSREAHGCPR
jgi:hypothetical protein